MSDLYHRDFQSRLEDAMRDVQKDCDVVTRFFQEPRHVEEIKGTVEDVEEADSWKKYGKDRMKTVSVAIIMCLHIGIDPPDAPPKPDPCAKLLAWVDPYQCNSHKAAQAVAVSLQKSYERWQPRARYKVACDPALEDVRKICTTLRRVTGPDRILFHYNGLGVPRPTKNGEIWVFNKSFTQYIPLSLFDMQSWIEYPSVYVWECSSAGCIIDSFQRFAGDHEKQWQKDFDAFQERCELPLSAISSAMDQDEQADVMGFLGRRPRFRECIHLAACQTGELLPNDPNMPADIFTSCLTTPVQTGILWYLLKSNRKSEFPSNILEEIPGSLTERKTVLGELNWIFTAITDTIAFTSLKREVFQRLFRQDLLLASLFRSFLLAQRVMMDYECHPISWPELADTSRHELWNSWDSTLDMVLDYVKEVIYCRRTNVVFSGREILLRSQVFPFITLVDFEEYLDVNDNSSNWFFVQQLQAFELWLDYGIDRGKPPLQLPVVLQVLLSQVHRVRALKLLARFLDFGQWAVGYSLSVGIFPYVLRLLQSNTRELRSSLAFIWAKILAVDPSCQVELFKENGDENTSAPSPQPRNQHVTLQQPGVHTRHSQGHTSTSSRQRHHPQFERANTDETEYTSRNARYDREDLPPEHHVASGTNYPPTRQRQHQQQQQPQPADQADGKEKTKIPLRYLYFVTILNDSETSPREKIVPAFVLATLFHNNYKVAQENLTEKGFVNLCTELLCEPDTRECRLLKLWILIGLGRLWSDYNDARWQAVRLVAYDKVIAELDDESPEVRAAAAFALGSLIKNSSVTNEHASFIDQLLADELCNRCTFDGASLVREELIVALQWFVFDFEDRFVKLLLDLARKCDITIPRKTQAQVEMDTEVIDIASFMVPSKSLIFNDMGLEPNSSFAFRNKVRSSHFLSPMDESNMRSRSEMFAVPSGYMVGELTIGSEDEEFRIRALKQIEHLEEKSFNEPIARTWLALLRLCLDPVEHIARSTQKIVRRVEMMTQKLKENMSEKLSSLTHQNARQNSHIEMRSSPQPTDQEPQRERPASESMDTKTMSRASDSNHVRFVVGSPAAVALKSTPNEKPPIIIAENEPFSEENSPAHSLPTVPHEIARFNSTGDSYHPSRKESVSSSNSNNKFIVESSMNEDEEMKRYPSEEFFEMILMNTERTFTPKRVTTGRGTFTKDGESTSLRRVINDPLVATQFIAWCSRIFVEPILDLLQANAEEDKKTDAILTSISPSDWSLHQLEGLRQAAEKELLEINKKKETNAKYELKVKTSGPSQNLTPNASINLRPHLKGPIKSMATSELRRCVYTTDGEIVCISSTAPEDTFLKTFRANGGNPFNNDKISQLLVINGMSREMIMCCSPIGIIRVWDPCYASYSEDTEREPCMLTTSFPLMEQTRLGLALPKSVKKDDKEKKEHSCIFDWNQHAGRVLCTGARSVRLWDAHCEKVVQDIFYNTSSSRSPINPPTALCGDLGSDSDLVAVGFPDGTVEVYDLRMPKNRAMRLSVENTTSPVMHLSLRANDISSGVLFAGNSNGLIATWEPRMYMEPMSKVQAPWQEKQHTAMSVHLDGRHFVTASGDQMRLYDVDGTIVTRFRSTIPAAPAKDKKGAPPPPQPKVTAVEMRQIRYQVLAAFDDGSIGVFSQKSAMNKKDEKA